MKERIKSIFSAALEKESLADRQHYLNEACGSDRLLRQEVESLLAAHFRAGGFLQKPLAASAAQKTLPIPLLLETTGTCIGRYKLLERIGEGGFGVVWMAEQEEPVRRRVALKIIKLGMDTKEVVARFEAERQALAMMDHPNIASVFDGGATETGRPYFVMELVKGVPITDYCDANKLSTRQRLELFMQVCHAVQHAHQKGVIHRDLKPSNILVTVKDDQPMPKVIDFGVAKATQARLTERTMFTQFRQLIGTPSYMSPEQAGLGSLDVDTRSDIYSLGVLLYELLTGRTPFDTQKLLEKGYDAVMRAICEEDPPKPSTRLSTLQEDELTVIATQRQADPGKLNRLVRGDLDWIVMKALEKDRRRRYEAVNALAQDVGRYLHAEPVAAVPPSLGYRMQKFARRNRKSLAGASVVLAGILLAAGSIGWVVRDRQARQAAFEQQIAGALHDAGKAYARGDLEAAGTAVRSAETLLRTASASRPIASWVQQWRTDLEMVKRLETIHESSLVAIFQSRSKIPGLGNELGDEHAIARECDQAYREAFDQYGWSIAEVSNPAAAAGRISRSLIKDRLVAALDHWAMMKWIQGSQDSQALFAIAEKVDHSPWRERLRKALLGGGDEELLKLAEDPTIVDSPPLFVKLFAVILDKAGRRVQAIDFLRSAQQSHPDDYWINELLGQLLCEAGKYQEGIGFGRAALALKPDAWWAHGILALNLSQDHTLRGQKDAEYHFRQAIQLNPGQPYHYAFAADTCLRQLGQAAKSTAAIKMTTLIKISLEPAASFYNQAINHGLRDHWTLYLAAPLNLCSGDVEAYRRCCALMVDQFGQTEDATVAARTAMTCLLSPDAVADLQPVYRLAEFSVKHAEQYSFNPWNVMTRSLAEYRGGRYEKAGEWLERCRPQTDACAATLASIRAMTLRQLGRSKEARQSLVHAQALISRHAFRNPKSEPYEVCDWVRAIILCQEAEALFGTERQATYSDSLLHE